MQIFLTVDLPTYVELVHEFYTSFKFDIGDDSTIASLDTVQFRLSGQYISMTVTAFSHFLGMITEEQVESGEFLTYYCEYPSSFNDQAYYSQISADPNPYDPRTSNICPSYFSAVFSFKFCKSS